MTRFPDLPQPRNADGAPRRTGVEIELGGLEESQVAEMAQNAFGGEIRQDDSRFLLEQSRIGDIEVYLDTALRKTRQSALRDLGLSLGREVIPVEIVTEPLDRDGLIALQDFCDSLREAGALGSRQGLLLGFGVHLNVEIASDSAADVVAPCFAYALIEDWLRHVDPIDDSRRLLPFTDPYPMAFTRHLARRWPEVSLEEFAALYLEDTPSRNRGLDMLPILAHLCPEACEGALPGAVSARPAFHFRLPDCRIDEAEWSLDHEWRRWRQVEAVAADAPLLEELAAAWRDDHGPLTLSRRHWAERCGEILSRAGAIQLDSAA